MKYFSMKHLTVANFVTLDDLAEIENNVLTEEERKTLNRTKREIVEGAMCHDSFANRSLAEKAFVLGFLASKVRYEDAADTE